MALCTFYFCFPILTVLAKNLFTFGPCHLRLCNCHTRPSYRFCLFFVDFPFWMRLGVRYHCYYLYSVVCQQIWRNVLPLFFPRYTGVKKIQHYKLFISNPIFLMFSFCKHFFLQKFFCKESAHCTSCYVAVGFFFLVLQNRTIGFEIKSL
jgi:hypothetical protein